MNLSDFLNKIDAVCATLCDYAIEYVANIGWLGVFIGNVRLLKSFLGVFRWVVKAVIFVIVLRIEGIWKRK